MWACLKEYLATLLWDNMDSLCNPALFLDHFLQVLRQELLFPEVPLADHLLVYVLLFYLLLMHLLLVLDRVPWVVVMDLRSNLECLRTTQ